MHISLPESFQWNVCSSWMKFVSSSACYLSCGLFLSVDLCWHLAACSVHTEVMLFSLCERAVRAAQDESTVKSGQHTTLLLRVGAWVGGLADVQTCQANLWVLTLSSRDAWTGGEIVMLRTLLADVCVCEFSQSSIQSNRILISGSPPYPTKTHT